MKRPRVSWISVGVTAVCLGGATSAGAGTLKCPVDSVQVGNVCIDLYEASVWQIAPTNVSLVKKVQAGKATLGDLTAGGATQLSPSSSCTPGYPGNFPASGQWTPVPGSNPPSPGVYAVSIPGVHPSACITWFQAAQACRLAGKRLLTNLEWQDAAAGTPDPGFTDNGTSDCNTSAAGDAVNTGSRANCKSSWGVFDMVGNVAEWVADWADVNTTGCTDSTTAFGFPGGDFVCFGGDGFPHMPAALIRDGTFEFGTLAGVFAVNAASLPSNSGYPLGFRCAR
jgi:formylglycine-generating enzyme required for sulfatase activity